MKPAQYEVELTFTSGTKKRMLSPLRGVRCDGQRPIHAKMLSSIHKSDYYRTLMPLMHNEHNRDIDMGEWKLYE